METCSVCGKKGVRVLRSGKGAVITVYNCRYCRQYPVVTAAQVSAKAPAKKE